VNVTSAVLGGRLWEGSLSPSMGSGTEIFVYGKTQPASLLLLVLGFVGNDLNSCRIPGTFFPEASECGAVEHFVTLARS
jgi:hypothetical protein